MLPRAAAGEERGGGSVATEPPKKRKFVGWVEGLFSSTHLFLPTEKFRPDATIRLP